MSTDAQTPFLGTPLVPLKQREPRGAPGSGGHLSLAQEMGDRKRGARER